jgi:hypothetical protein
LNKLNSSENFYFLFSTSHTQGPSTLKHLDARFLLSEIGMMACGLSELYKTSEETQAVHGKRILIRTSTLAFTSTHEVANMKEYKFTR